MLNAAIKACPTFDGRLASFDDTGILDMPGVRKIVRDLKGFSRPSEHEPKFSDLNEGHMMHVRSSYRNVR